MATNLDFCDSIYDFNLQQWNTTCVSCLVNLLLFHHVQISIREAIQNHHCILYRLNLLKLMPLAVLTRSLTADR